MLKFIKGKKPKFDPSRRRAMGAIAAAPLAAPSLSEAQRFGFGVASGIPPSGLPGDSGPSPSSYLLERKTDLEKVLRGERDERDEASDKYDNTLEIAFRFESLRSVSPTNRARMFKEWQRKRNSEQRMLWASWELKDIAKKLWKLT